MEEREKRRKLEAEILPLYKEVLSAHECDDPAHQKITKIIRVNAADHSIEFGKVCCNNFKERIEKLFEPTAQMHS